tara:strand:+ start:684 stop:980 length:297 start_codon:yes stop_codon:yes gene_type:complete
LDDFLWHIKDEKVKHSKKLKKLSKKIEGVTGEKPTKGNRYEVFSVKKHNGKEYGPYLYVGTQYEGKVNIDKTSFQEINKKYTHERLIMRLLSEIEEAI